MNKLTDYPKKRVAALLLLFLCNFSIAGDFAVSPMMINLQGVDRSSHRFEFNIFGKSDSDIKLTLYDMTQLETGYMGFSESNLEDNESMAGWVTLDDMAFSIRDGETTTVSGNIDVPSRAAGTHLLGVMVEEDIPEEEQSGISVKIRYAVVLNMRVEGTTNRRIKTQFEELVLVQQDDGAYIQGTFQNDSAVDDWLESQVQIRDANNRLVERVELKTESAWQRDDEASRVFPGAKVRVYGKLTKNDQSGDFNVMVRNRFAEKSQPVYRDKIRIEAIVNEAKENLVAADGIPEQRIQISPRELPIEIRRNGSSFSTFFITNNGDDALSIDLPTSFDDPASLGIQDFQFYPKNLEVAPGQKARVVLKQSHLTDKEYQNIEFMAKAASSNSEEQIEFTIMTVSGDQS